MTYPSTTRGLEITGVRQVALVDHPLAPLASGEVLVRSLLSAIKHGTEAHLFKGVGPFADRKLHDTLRVFVPDDTPKYPRPAGNMTVGTVVAVGRDVTAVAPGAEVYGWWPIRTHHVCRVTDVNLLDGLTPEQALCHDPAYFGFGAVHDARIGLGARVALFGPGAIGLFAVQMVKASGAQVFVVSGQANRLALAERFGADAVLDRRTCADPARTIKEMTGGGVDVALECSGNTRTLHEAIRSVRPCGRVVTLGFYPGEGEGLRLGEEFFHNRLEMIASLPAPRWNNPDRQYPLWDRARMQRLVVDLFKNGTLTADGIIDPVLPFERATEAFRLIEECPHEVVKIGISYAECPY